MATPKVTRFIGDEDEMWIWWKRNGALINFSSGSYSYEAKLASTDDPDTVIFTKVAGFTGAAGSGTQTSEGGVPNLVIQFSATGELNHVAIVPGTYIFQVKATLSGAETTGHVLIEMRERI